MGKASRKNKLQEPNNRVLVTQQTYIGPIPDPLSLDRYENILPGSANRIVIMAELEQKYRHTQTNKIINKELNLQLLGMIFAFVICILVFGLAFYLFYLNKDIIAITAIIGNFLTFGGLFFFSKKTEKKNNTIMPM